MTRVRGESAEYILHYYDNYFGIKYPMPKLDMVAFRTLRRGRWRTSAAITYRETDLLVDVKTALDSSEEEVVACGGA